MIKTILSDQETDEAGRIYTQLKLQEDPYALVKTIEYFLHKKLRKEVDKCH